MHILLPVTDNCPSAERKRKVCGQTGYRTQDLWLMSQVPYWLRYAAQSNFKSQYSHLLLLSAYMYMTTWLLVIHGHYLLILWISSTDIARKKVSVQRRKLLLFHKADFNFTQTYAHACSKCHLFMKIKLVVRALPNSDVRKMLPGNWLNFRKIMPLSQVKKKYYSGVYALHKLEIGLVWPEI